MATRAPRTTVSKTSGQAISRGSYQRAYELGQRGTGGMAEFRNTGSKRDYAKGKAKPDKEGSINISYGETYEPTDLADVEALGKGGPGRPPSSKHTTKTWK